MGGKKNTPDDLFFVEDFLRRKRLLINHPPPPPPLSCGICLLLFVVCPDVPAHGGNAVGAGVHYWNTHRAGGIRYQ